MGQGRERGEKEREEEKRRINESNMQVRPINTYFPYDNSPTVPYRVDRLR